jgi:hypothetical protein
MENPLGLSAFTGTWECVDRMGESQLSSLLTITQVGRDLWEVDYAQEQNPALDKPYKSTGVW